MDHRFLDDLNNANTWTREFAGPRERTNELAQPLSVTEHITKLLDKEERLSKEVFWLREDQRSQMNTD